jgi:hypothetical protein
VEAWRNPGYGSNIRCRSEGAEEIVSSFEISKTFILVGFGAHLSLLQNDARFVTWTQGSAKPLPWAQVSSPFGEPARFMPYFVIRRQLTIRSYRACTRS